MTDPSRLCVPLSFCFSLLCSPITVRRYAPCCFDGHHASSPSDLRQPRGYHDAGLHHICSPWQVPTDCHSTPSVRRRFDIFSILFFSKASNGKREVFFFRQGDSLNRQMTFPLFIILFDFSILLSFILPHSPFFRDDDSSIRAEASNLVTRCLSSKAPLSHEHAVRAWWAHCSAIGAQEGDWKRWLWDQLMDRKEIGKA